MTEQATSYSESVNSNATTNYGNNFKTILIDPIKRVVSSSTFLPIISQFAQGVFYLLQVLLAYYYVNQQASIVIALTFVIIQLIKHIVISPIYGVLKKVQERLMAEQGSSANMLYDHIFVIIIALSVIIVCFMIAFSKSIATSLTGWAGDVIYFPLMVQGMPILLACQYTLYILISENKGNYISLIEIAKTVIHAAALYVVIIIMTAQKTAVTLKTFAIIELVINAVFAVACLKPILLFSKGKESITRFSIGFSAFKDFKMPIFWMSTKAFLLYMICNLSEYAIPILAFVIIFKQTETETKNGMFIAFAFFVTYQQISCAVSRAVQGVLLQVFTPNVQMKRYERISALMTGGFGMLFLISVVLNLVLFIICNYMITVVFYDVTYNSAGGEFVEVGYSIDTFYSIKYVAMEGLFRPLQTFVICTSEITQTASSYFYVVVVKYIAVIGMFLISYFTNITKSINYMVITEATVDLCCVLPYINLLQKFNKLRSKMNEMEQTNPINDTKSNRSKTKSSQFQDNDKTEFQIEEIKPMPLPTINLGRQSTQHSGFIQSRNGSEPDISSQVIPDKSQFSQATGTSTQQKSTTSGNQNSSSDLIKFPK
ncbi:MatE_and transmembrane domain-containing protein [Hexamita inflata]|uniref:MatE and transmembrane domain-containing protein n=1 Tax=Hexamita inflata TaxID=28002 RepID=A0AA86ULQ8_9EUKA|nr:MatE and transmembrane domain-containing protein [Hexamita inflata]